MFFNNYHKTLNETSMYSKNLFLLKRIFILNNIFRVQLVLFKKKKFKI